MEILLHPRGEIYIAPCGEDLTLVALLLEGKSMRYFSGDLPGRYVEFLKSVRGFQEPAFTSDLYGRVFAVGPLGFTVEPWYRPGLLLIGDSAGFLDPITGEGMTLALKSIQGAVPLIKAAFGAGDFGAELGQRYAEMRLRLTEDLFRLTRLMLNFCRYKFIADRMVRRLSHDDALFQKLLGIVTRCHRFKYLTLREKFSLVLG